DVNRPQFLLAHEAAVEGRQIPHVHDPVSHRRLAEARMKRDAERPFLRQRGIPLEPSGKAKFAMQHQQRLARAASNYLKIGVTDTELHFFPTLIRHVSSISSLEFSHPRRGRRAPSAQTA